MEECQKNKVPQILIDLDRPMEKYLFNTEIILSSECGGFLSWGGTLPKLVI